MKEVIFKTLYIKNFLSIGNEPIVIKFEPGIHIITGVNKDKEDSKNGIGKTTIADAIFFVMFGSPLRPIKKDSITNWVNKKDCVVSIVFDVINNGQSDEYTLTRSLNPSQVELFKNKVDITRTIGKTNETVFEIIETTSEVFEQIVVLCLNEVVPFLAKTPAVKRKFIEDIFKLEIFGRMTAYIRNDFNETNLLYNSETEKITGLDADIASHKKHQLDQKENRVIHTNELEARKNTIQEEINHIKQKITEEQNKTSFNSDDENVLLQKIEKLRTKEKEILEADKQYIKTVTANQTTILNIKNKIKEIEKLSDGVCAYCKQPFSESNIQEKKNLISKHKEEVNECAKILEEAETKANLRQKFKATLEDLIEELNQKYSAITSQKSKLVQFNTELKQQEEWLSRTIKDIDNITKESDSFKDIISELIIRRDVLIENIKKYKDKLELIETSKFIVSDEGVKKIIVKKMLTMLNGRLNSYLKQLDANCTCTFDEYFIEMIINNRGRECSYYNFSGGEKKRIDLAMLFTFMDIRRKLTNLSVNIGIYDELLDTSLDLKGIEQTLNILKERVLNNKEAIYIISHKSEAAKHATGEIIYLEKENDVTRRKPYEYITTNNPIQTN